MVLIFLLARRCNDEKYSCGHFLPHRILESAPLITFITFCQPLAKYSLYYKKSKVEKIKVERSQKSSRSIWSACKMCFLAVLFCTLSVFHSTTAFCERKYKKPYWIPKSLSQRAAEADIVIYGNVTESPCMKPISVNPKQIFPAACIANATNSSTVFNSSVQQPTPNLNITEGNITDICLTCALYNVSLQVHCVIKGGSVPRMVHLRGLGFGPGMCTYGTYIYNYMETVLTFQMYKDRNYVIFLGR